MIQSCCEKTHIHRCFSSPFGFVVICALLSYVFKIYHMQENTAQLNKENCINYSPTTPRTHTSQDSEHKGPVVACYCKPQQAKLRKCLKGNDSQSYNSTFRSRHKHGDSCGAQIKRNTCLYQSYQIQSKS